MTTVIRIDDQVMKELHNKAISLGLVFPTPNEVLRVILELDTSPNALSDQGEENMIVIDFRENDKKYDVIRVPEEYRSFFPGDKEKFELITDVRIFTAFVNNNGRIKGRLGPWFEKHPELKLGHRYRIERVSLETGKRYKLSVVSKGV